MATFKVKLYCCYYCKNIQQSWFKRNLKVFGTLSVSVNVSCTFPLSNCYLELVFALFFSKCIGQYIMVSIFNILYVCVFKNSVKKKLNDIMNWCLGNVSLTTPFPLLLSQKKRAIKKERGYFSITTFCLRSVVHVAVYQNITEGTWGSLHEAKYSVCFLGFIINCSRESNMQDLWKNTEHYIDICSCEGMERWFGVV